ncbi:hypothetical protein ABA45_00535 [Marinobacter psychrophilus]|uniref:Uncharacterized protein n=1 Tax=Marinobacter psychrophilus TaxID=330734 RepID=A0A0H4I7Q2_9GAMM|nr:hypothetical protein ABA45_00535 [Marinobacter psychrophilus]
MCSLAQLSRSSNCEIHGIVNGTLAPAENSVSIMVHGKQSVGKCLERMLDAESTLKLRTGFSRSIA